MTKAFYITAAELAKMGKDNIPDELLSAKHLIYSSPATLAFNSPGAQGFGVKSRTCSAKFGYASCGSCLLWTKHHYAQCGKRLRRQIFLPAS